MQRTESRRSNLGKYVAGMLNMFRCCSERLPYKRAVGSMGEQLAVRFLRKKGYKILQRNYRCRTGEIDIVCYERGTIVFVEVKTRHSSLYGPPEVSVTRSKMIRIVRVAMHYMTEKQIQGENLRFDVVSILHVPGKKHPFITLYRNAFTKDRVLPG